MTGVQTCALPIYAADIGADMVLVHHGIFWRNEPLIVDRRQRGRLEALFRANASLAEIDEPVDLVDVFRTESAAPGHAREAVEAGAKAFWLQLDLRSSEARAICEEAGLDYVEDECTAIVHRRI